MYRIYWSGLKSLQLLFVVCLLSACGPKPDEIPTTTREKISREPVDALDRVTAQARKARVSNVFYDIEIDLDNNGNDEFGGTATIRFDLSEMEQQPNLTVDFGHGTVAGVELNGSTVDAGYNRFFLTLPGDHLKSGANSATVRYTHPFSEDGTGLHRFVDPADGLTYLYSYLWPYYANRIFPLFDQPDLKARYTLAVHAPEDWVVISLSEGRQETSSAGRVAYHFDITPVISSYAFSLHAGPYRVWEENAEGVAMRLMARQSLAEFVAVEEWFEITRRGLAFFGNYFDIAYPFGKYDQLIVPDFTIGAMENIAAVTFKEGYVQRQASSRREREQRAETILHEMAHMWFGNLVTHVWWNGMWLNESFATQMANLAMVSTSDFTDTWHGFFTDIKRAAYRADSLVTTHPIEMPVRSTDDFFMVFDDITYQKGASTLKQLMHWVGEDNYRLGVSAYLKSHSYGNTELEDFISAQAESSGMNLEDWTRVWLYEPGFNSLAAQPVCKADVLQSLTITQSTPPAHPVLRMHSIEIALYLADEAGGLQPAVVLPVIIDGATTQVSLPAGSPCPVIINPNHNDWTLARIELDDRTLQALKTYLGDIPEPLSRSMFLAALHERAMQGEVPLAAYLEHAMRLAENESNARVMQQVTTSIVGTVSMMQRLRPQTDVSLAHWLPVLEMETLERASNAEAIELKRAWFDTFIATASTEDGLGAIREFLDGERTISGLPISQDLRWILLARLAAFGGVDIEARLVAESKADISDFGVKSALTANAAIPDKEQKQKWLKELRNPESITVMAQQRAIIAGLFPANQTLLQRELLQSMLDSLTVVSQREGPYFTSSYVSGLLTPMCTKESAAMMEAAVATYTDKLDSTTLRFLREGHQSDSECALLRSRQ